MSYIIDILAGGNGIAFGKEAERPIFDVNMDVEIKGKTLLDLIHPVDSIYISYSHTNPSSLFGGTWMRITNAFLYACEDGDNIGATGGEKEHVLSIDEMPSHTHTQEAHSHWLPYSANDNGVQSMGKYVVSSASNTTNGKGYTGNLATLPASPSNEFSGRDNAHNNMPPYMKVSIWRRVS